MLRLVLNPGRMGSMSKNSSNSRSRDDESANLQNLKAQTQTYSLFRIPSSSSKSPSTPRPSGVKGLNQKEERKQDTVNHLGWSEQDGRLTAPDMDKPSTLSPSATIRDLYYQSQKLQEDDSETLRPSYQTQQEVVAKSHHQAKYDDNSSIYDVSSHVGQGDDDEDDDENDFIYSSTATFMQFKEATPSLYSLSDAGSVFSLRTIYNDNDDGKIVPPPSTVLGNAERSRVEEMRAVSPIPTRSSNMIAKRAMEPKIVIHQKEEARPLSSSSIPSSNLLSRLSKSTAPARAKLFNAPRTSNVGDTIEMCSRYLKLIYARFTII